MATFDMLEHFITIDGMCIYKNFVNHQQDILNLEVYDDDLWVVTFPKSGTTWMQEMVWLIANDLDFIGARKSLNVRFPFLEIIAVNPVSNLLTEPDDYVPIKYIDDSINYIKQQQRPRFIKTHLPWKFLPIQVQKHLKKPKIIYVARNPKDVCVSFYYHCKLIDGYNGTLEEFCDLFLTNETYYCPYWDHVLSFRERRNHDNICFVTYEDMKADLPSVVKTIANFLGKELNEDEMIKLCQHLSFDAMKNNMFVNKRRSLEALRQYMTNSYSGDFIRSGIVGSYKSEMSEEMRKRFDKWIEENNELI